MPKSETIKVKSLTMNGPIGEPGLQHFSIIDGPGAEVARVFVISHEADANHEKAIEAAGRRALKVCRTIAIDIADYGLV